MTTRVRMWALMGGAAIVLGGLGWLATPATVAVSAERDAAADVAALSARVGELEEIVAHQQEQIDEMTKLVADHDKTTKGLLRGAKALANAAKDSRKNGFEAAGPNPRSKTQLLDGLDAFSRAIESSRETKKK